MKKSKVNLKIVIIAAVIIVLFTVLAILVNWDNRNSYKNLKENPSINAWLKDTKSSEKIVTVVGTSWCGNCAALKESMSKVLKKYDFKVYWYEIDILEKEDKETYDTLINTYNISENEYDGHIPYVFLTQNGEVVNHFGGARDKDGLIEELKEFGVIK